MSDECKCIICVESLTYRWTDTHGIGACVSCGAPYTIYHYENDKRVDKAPECLILDKWVDIIKQYWEEKRRNCSPGAFNFPGSSYEVATIKDFAMFNDWMEENKP